MTSTAPHVLAISGSTRDDALNTRLVRLAAAAAEQAGARVTCLHLGELQLPLYSIELEASEGLPPGAKRLKELLLQSRGLLISSPEHNSSVSAALKNAIDWASRKEEADEPPLAAYQGKVAGLLSASPSPMGGLRGLVHLRAILGNIGVLVLPEQVTVPGAGGAFGPDGDLQDPALRGRVEKIGARVAWMSARLES